MGRELAQRWVFAYALGVILAAGALAYPGGFAPVLLSIALPVALAFSPLEKVRTFGPWLLMTIPGALSFWWLAADPSKAAFTFAPLLALSLAGAILFAKNRCREATQSVTLLALTLEVCLVAYLSSGAGGSGAMLHWLLAHGFSNARAGEITLVFRKSVHFTFYGTVGWTALSAARSAGATPLQAARTGILTALSLASFDELRQSGYADRTGSIWDVLLDLAGATVFVGLSEVRRRQTR